MIPNIKLQMAPEMFDDNFKPEPAHLEYFQIGLSLAEHPLWPEKLLSRILL